MIPKKRNPAPNAPRGFGNYSSPPSITSESTTEPESVTTTSSGTVVSRRYVGFRLEIIEILTTAFL
jgi:hypothetical protein